MGKKRKKLPGTVEKIIKPVHPSQPEKAQINLDGADDLYKEIRIDNVVTDETGHKARLKSGAEVDVTIEADAEATESLENQQRARVSTSTGFSRPHP